MDSVHDGVLTEFEWVAPDEVVSWMLTNAHWTGGDSFRVGARIRSVQNAEEARGWLAGLAPDPRGALAGVLRVGQDEDGVFLGVHGPSWAEGGPVVFRFRGARLTEA